MAKKSVSLKSFIISTLRRASFRWPKRNDAMKLARISRGLYLCAGCKKPHRNKEIRIDHIEPVVGMKGFIGWDSYIERMFCDVTGFQILCLQCHATKTELENKKRS